MDLVLVTKDVYKKYKHGSRFMLEKIVFQCYFPVVFALNFITL